LENEPGVGPATPLGVGFFLQKGLRGFALLAFFFPVFRLAIHSKQFSHAPKQASFPKPLFFFDRFAVKKPL